MKNPPISRVQRRFNERILKEVNDTLQKLTIKFYDFFMDNDPEGEAVANKQKELSAKWKMYCKRASLIEAAFDLFDKNANKIIEDYKTQKAEG